jgi:hypothetical protein
MSHTNQMFPAGTLERAEHELAAFLRAAVDVVGHSGIPRAGDIWIRAMESLDWRNQSIEKFFRTVTIRAAADLAKSTRAGMSHEKSDQTAGETSMGIVRLCVGNVA